MIQLPEFTPLAIDQRPPAAKEWNALDRLLIVLPALKAVDAIRDLPDGERLQYLLQRAGTSGAAYCTSRLDNARATGVTVTARSRGSAFDGLTWARKALRECLREKPARLGILTAGLTGEAHRDAVGNLAAAAHAAAFRLPCFKSKPPPDNPLKRLTILAAGSPIDPGAVQARALGNNVARWFTALPANALDVGNYRRLIATLCGRYGIDVDFLDESRLAELGANAFLAVSQGNRNRDAGIVRVRYRPAGTDRAELALIGKGILFDTGGTNLKPFANMLEMHADMQGSAVALGTLLALASLEAPYGVDAWLPLTENRISATAYKSQDIVRACNGTTIQVIHTDAEGRMVLADTLALAAGAATRRAEPGCDPSPHERPEGPGDQPEKPQGGRPEEPRRNLRRAPLDHPPPQLMIDYATLTGACVSALTRRYSGVFSNRAKANEMLREAGARSGERVWPFPMDKDYDKRLRSHAADVRQCATSGDGDHIVAARFLSRFVPDAVPWIHVDLSAGRHKGGLAHIPTDITGFGVRFTLELLKERRPAEFAAALS